MQHGLFCMVSLAENYDNFVQQIPFDGHIMATLLDIIELETPNDTPGFALSLLVLLIGAIK